MNVSDKVQHAVTMFQSEVSLLYFLSNNANNVTNGFTISKCPSVILLVNCNGMRSVETCEKVDTSLSLTFFRDNFSALR